MRRAIGDLADRAIGVRPSPGAATQEAGSLQKVANGIKASRVAVPEDAHTDSSHFLRRPSQSVRNCPPPNPLPEGEGTANFGRGQTSGVGFAHRLWTILPLPLGEGRGEGNFATPFPKTEI